jgi:hypothetical protein
LWSALGDLIMFVRLVDDAYQIHTIKPDGTGQKRLRKESRLVALFAQGKDLERMRSEAIGRGVPLGEVKSGRRRRPHWLMTELA